MAPHLGMILAMVLLLIAVFGVYQAVTAGESGARGAFRLIDGVVILTCVLGAGWLIISGREHAA